MEKTALAYLAGFFDGEGTICICKRANRNSFTLRIAIGQMERAPLVLFENAFGGRIHQLKRGARSDMLQWNLMVRDQQIGFLRMMLPYLRSKRREAEIALAFLENTAKIGFGGFQAKRHPELLVEREELHRLCKEAKVIKDWRKPTTSMVKL